MSEKSFLAVGDVLINPALLAYAAIETDSEGPQLRLGFASQADMPQREIRLAGIEARSVLRWLRRNAEFLDAGSPAHRWDRARCPLVAQIGPEARGHCHAPVTAMGVGSATQPGPAAEVAPRGVGASACPLH